MMPSRSTVAMAIGAELNSRANLSSAAAASSALAGGAVEHQRMREPAIAAIARQAMQDAHRKRGAVSLDEVDVEAPRVAVRSAAAGSAR